MKKVTRKVAKNHQGSFLGEGSGGGEMFCKKTVCHLGEVTMWSYPHNTRPPWGTLGCSAAASAATAWQCQGDPLPPPRAQRWGPPCPPPLLLVGEAQGVAEHPPLERLCGGEVSAGPWHGWWLVAKLVGPARGGSAHPVKRIQSECHSFKE